jgi:hypothetical protein
MTPEETEARFERIESALEATAEQMQLLLIGMNRLTESAIRGDRLHAETEQYKLENEQYKRENELWKRDNELWKRENEQRRLENEQRRLENEQWKRESDQRFNILLEEVRASNRRIEIIENQ